jgi:hypothetical protein
MNVHPVPIGVDLQVNQVNISQYAWYGEEQPMVLGSVEGRFHQCRCLCRVVTEEVQIAKDTPLTVDPIYNSVKPRREVRHASTYLSTFR